MKVSPYEAVIAVVIVVGATVTDVLHDLAPEALVGIYASVLGYVFGRGAGIVKNGMEGKR